LSKANHYLVACSTPGIHIGGEPATTETLAICMLCLQSHAYSELDLIVTGPDGLEKCLLSAGAVNPMPAVAAAAAS
jgi:23S rRNA pseudoU1915 N3-methylase RlmH